MKMRRLAWGALAIGGVVAASRAVRARHRFDVRGKSVLIAGGSRGLGLVLARQLAERGARVALLARDADELERAGIDLLAAGAGAVFVVPCDITDAGDVQRAIARVVDAFGSVDVLVNDAGLIQVAPLEAMSDGDFERSMATHFWGPFHLARAVLPAMRARRSGRIVNISSIGGLVPVPHLLPYVASKFALTGFSLGLRAELAKDEIVVTTICPGLMRTGSPDHARFKGNRAAEFGWFGPADSLPFLSMSAERAARRIVRALRYGEPLVVLGAPAKAAALLHALAPRLAAMVLQWVNRALPADATGGRSQSGRESRSARLPAWLTTLSDRAAARNNE
ncbi:MAG: SDR family NAD(P)-dependent oxidoreductase [Myxococcota bacterium]|nr:SDR family NAD(P)-dependent oxidoreductase [Myxococcota bacterium]